MTSGANGEWVRQGTPHDDNADWNEEQSEYGTAISPTEWDDYSSEQSVPVTPRAHADGDVSTDGSPASPAVEEHSPVPGQEPDAGDEYRSGDVDPTSGSAPQGDADEHGMQPARVDEPADALGVDEATFAGADEFSDVPDDEITRPRPIVPDASMTAMGATAVASPAMVQATDGGVGHAETADLVEDPAEDSALDREFDEPADNDAQESVAMDERHVDAADYLAVDPVPLEEADTQAVAHDVADEPVSQDMDQEMSERVDTNSDAEPTQYVETDSDAEPTQYVETDSDAEPTQYVETDSDAEPTQYVDTDDMEHTQAVPVIAPVASGGTAATPGHAGTVPDGLYRAGGAEETAGMEETAVIAQGEYPDTDADVEEERRQASLDAERQAREQRLGAVPTSPDNAMREDFGPPRVTTDRFLPSFGLFVMRIVLAGVLGLASFQILGSGVDATANFLAGYPLIPEPRLVAWILGFTLGAMALLLVIGLLQRVVGFLLLVISVAALVFIRWGNFQIFTSGGLWVDGFIGDKDLLLAAIGLVLLTIGGGAWGIDGAFRRARAESKAEKQG
ncbi:DoxX family membrane protein [Tessaracoccus antarcticus]|uniref:DoxX family membrane protein n=1 Tax=Tessaracoccus antarcticus TaxID=2479848 RepID=A0A3M0G8A1_9ACTN|nr:DoxX family membrane protein [Tessaracoccus antarcticus]RMB61195.1 hypothetical protein EAX62_00500 [Tessaracoccus antarcticus]